MKNVRLLSTLISIDHMDSGSASKFSIYLHQSRSSTRVNRNWTRDHSKKIGSLQSTTQSGKALIIGFDKESFLKIQHYNQSFFIGLNGRLTDHQKLKKKNRTPGKALIIDY